MMTKIKNIAFRTEFGRWLAGAYRIHYYSMGRKKYREDLKTYNRLCTYPSFFAEKKNRMEILTDAKDSASGGLGEYFFQDLLVASLIHEADPEEHYDIGSRVDGFIAHILSFRQGKKTAMIDIRPLERKIPGLSFVQGDATELPTIEDDSLESLSCLHACEHFGLGRYGDPVDPDACFKAMKSMQRVLKKGGILYFSVPTGKEEKCCFNAHRIFRPHTITDTFDRLHLTDFYYFQKPDQICHLSGEEYQTADILNLLSDEMEGCAAIYIFRKD